MPTPTTVAGRLFAVAGVHLCALVSAGYVRYDTIRYGRLTCAQKLTGWHGQLNLAHGPKMKKGKNKITNRVAQKKRSRQRSVEAVREEEAIFF